MLISICDHKLKDHPEVRFLHPRFLGLRAVAMAESELLIEQNPLQNFLMHCFLRLILLREHVDLTSGLLKFNVANL